MEQTCGAKECSTRSCASCERNSALILTFNVTAASISPSASDESDAIVSRDVTVGGPEKEKKTVMHYASRLVLAQAVSGWQRRHLVRGDSTSPPL